MAALISTHAHKTRPQSPIGGVTTRTGACVSREACIAVERHRPSLEFCALNGRLRYKRNGITAPRPFHTRDLRRVS